MAGEACLGHRGIPARGSFGLQSNPRSPQVRAIKKHKQTKKHEIAFCFFRWGEKDLCEFFYCFSASGYLKKNSLSTFFLCVRVCVHIYLIAHITTQSGPVTLLIVIVVCY